MKRKVIALMGAVLLVASMSMTALAAPSVQAGIVTGVETATDKNGGAVDLEKLLINEVDDEMHFDAKDEAAVAEIQKPEKLAEILKATEGVTYKSTMKLADIKEVVIVDEQGKEVDPTTVNWPITITFKVNGVKATDNVTVLHHEATGWVKVPSTAGNGIVKATFTSLSPVAFIVESAATSPSTGTPVMMAMAAVALGVAGVVSSKKKA